MPVCSARKTPKSVTVNNAHTFPSLTRSDPPPHLRPADERGFTLQTLIVTAVVVVVAVIVTVVLIAITSNANEDLAASDSDMKSRCGPGEIFDPELHAAGHGSVAAHGGIKSSAIGCRQFCYIESNELFGWLPDTSTYPEEVIETPGLRAREGWPHGSHTNTWWLKHSTEKSNQQTRNSENISWLYGHEGNRYTVLPVVGPRHADSEAISFAANRQVNSVEVELVQNGSFEPYEIRVHPSNEYCVVQYSDSGEVVFRSTELLPAEIRSNEFGTITAGGPNGEDICRPRRDNVPRSGNCPTDGPTGIQTS